MTDDASLARARSLPRQYAAATGIVLLAALACLAFRAHLAIIDVGMLFLCAVAVAASRCAAGPAYFASALSVACFDFLFVPPYYTFGVHDTAYLLTFAMMFVVALVMSRLTATVRAQAMAARARERRIAALFSMHRELSSARDDDQVRRVVTDHLGRLAGPVSVILDPAASESAQWDDDALVVPLQTPTQRFGLVRVVTSEPGKPLDDDGRRIVGLLADQAAVALERLTLARRNEAAQLAVEAERLRTALLSSLSHDLRTPLGTIEGAATALLEDAATLPATAQRELAEAIVAESRRMARLVSNLLDMVRLETGTLAVHRSWQPLEESLGVALIRLDDRLAGHPVTVELPADLPLVCTDEVLIEQVFVNLLDNAIKYTPADTPISITAWLEHYAVVVELADRGPGIAPGEEEQIFHKFHRSRSRDDHAATSGSGLGLTICAGIVSAHGGEMWAIQREGGGAAFRFTLPLDAAPLPYAPATG